MYSVVAEMQGMVAENQQRENNGQALAYCMEDFDAISGRFMDIANRLRMN